MSEIKNHEVNEIRTPDVENYKKIQPENGMTVAKAKEFWNQKIKEAADKERTSDFGGRYVPEEKRLQYTPADNERGRFSGERGNSKYIPSGETENGRKCIEKLAEYGKNGIEYKNLEPDFSEVSEATVTIDKMTEHREDYYDENGSCRSGNFSQADERCAEAWNKEMKDKRSDWSAKDVYKWRHDPEHHCTWHERCDTKTMDLVPYEIHDFFTHSGGVAECKARDNVDDGGGFDE